MHYRRHDEGPERPIRLVLELDSHAEPISGQMRAEDGRTRRFFGWLELAGALRTAFADEPAGRTPGPGPDSTGPGRAPA
jgi:hypothetical protein